MSLLTFADVEQELSDSFAEHGARGAEGALAFLRRPRVALRSLLLISRLPVLAARLDGSGDGDTVRSGLLRTNRLARALVRGTTAVLVLPDDPADFVAGSSASKRSLRTKYNKATRQGFQVLRPRTDEERRALLVVAARYEREHRDERYRNEQPELDHLLAVRHWFVAADADGTPLLLAVPGVSGEWAVLEHFKTLQDSDDARLARFWMSVEIVAELRALGVRYFADVLSPIGLPPGLRDFQRRLGYRLFRVVVR